MLPSNTYVMGLRHYKCFTFLLFRPETSESNVYGRTILKSVPALKGLSDFKIYLL